MTEDEAKTKWCPFVRLGVTGCQAGGVNRIADISASKVTTDIAPCIVSQCIAWRYIDGYGPEETKLGDKTKGYCGLAGKP